MWNEGRLASEVSPPIPGFKRIALAAVGRGRLAWG